MLKKWILGNFKSVAEVTELEFAPITVLAGTNSSGKSTILQSILTISQTVRSTAGMTPLVLNGEFIRLGYLTDVIHNHSDGKPIVFGFEIDGNDDKNDAIASNTFPVKLHFQVRVDKTVDDQPYGRLKEITIQWPNGFFALEELSVSHASIWEYSDRLQVPLDILNELKQGKYTYVPKSDSSLRSRNILPFAPQFDLNHFLPLRFLETHDAFHLRLKKILLEISDLLMKDLTRADEQFLLEISQDSKVNQILKKLLREILLAEGSKQSQETQYYQYKGLSASRFGRVGMLGEGIRYINREVPSLYRNRLAKEIKASVDSVRLRVQDIPYSEIGVSQRDIPEPLDRIIDRIANYFSKKICYLGPLRESPQYLYLLPPYPDIKYVGTKGEFTAAVLERYKGEQIEYPLPPGTYKKGHQAIDRGPLAYALQVWLEHMGLLENVRTKDLGKMGTEMTVRSSGVDRDLDLTSIGVGVSQVLPTLVGCLIAPRDTLFLLEQPELHLHPKVQAILADFLLGLSHIGKQCIVETHSEYLINRLRRRVAEDEREMLIKDIQIYFVERENGKSHFRKVDLNAYGAILEWPKGFFDEGPSESQLIMEAAMRKRRRVQSAGQE